MFELTPVEILGYAASLFVVASLAMSSVVRLRLLSLTGSTLFLVYAILIGSIPVAVTNAAIIGINIWYLRAELGRRRTLGVSPIPADSPFLADFLAFHLDDIRRFQPSVELPEPEQDTVALLLTRDGLPAGVVLGRRRGTELDIAVDYVVSAYRDSRLGQWLFGPGRSVFRAAGFDRLSTAGGTEEHRSYLERVGFRRQGDRWTLPLDD
ncbi:MAG: YgjV family protein [Acidimicrobiales bacterium]